METNSKEDVKGKLSKFEEEIKLKDKEIFDLKASIQAKIEENQANSAKFKEDLALKDTEIKALNAKIEFEMQESQVDAAIFKEEIVKLKVKIQENEVDTAIFKEEIEFKDQQIRELNTKIQSKIEENEANTNSLKTKFEAEMAKKEEIGTIRIEYDRKIDQLSKEKEEVQNMLEIEAKSNNNIIKQKDTRISQLEDQLTALKDQLTALESKLALKNAEPSEKTLKLAKIKELARLFKEELVSEPSKISTFMMENGKICEIREEEDEIKLIQRQKHKERADFIFWVKEKQFCGELKDKKWLLSLYSGQNKVDALEIEGNHKEGDKFYLIGNRVYIGLFNTFELYRVTVKREKMQLESFGQTPAGLCSLCEHRDYFFIGLSDATVQQVKEQKFEQVLEMSGNVTYLRVDSNHLFVSDYNGKAIKYNISSNTKKKGIQVDGYFSFLFEDKVGRSDGTNLYIHDWKGGQLKKFAYSSGDGLYLLKQTDKYSVVGSNSSLVIIDHATLLMKKYATEGIPNRYLNF